MDKKHDKKHQDQDEKFLLNVRDAAALLEIKETELWELVHQHKVPTHVVAGAFLRFRRDDIEQLKNKWRIQRELFPKKERFFAHKNVVKKATFIEDLADFWYFNDFYIICAALITALLYFIISSQ